MVVNPRLPKLPSNFTARWAVLGFHYTLVKETQAHVLSVCPPLSSITLCAGSDGHQGSNLHYCAVESDYRLLVEDSALTNYSLWPWFDLECWKMPASSWKWLLLWQRNQQVPGCSSGRCLHSKDYHIVCDHRDSIVQSSGLVERVRRYHPLESTW